MLEKLVNTPVRGVVNEAESTAPRDLFEEGAAIARKTALTYRMPVQIVDREPADVAGWAAAMRAAVHAVLTD